jgi:iron complex outermembrane recepter protein
MIKTEVEPKSLARRLALLLLAGAALPGVAMAQDNAGTGGEIVVTAQKKAERLIDVPVSVTAVGADLLRDQGLNRLSDLAQRVPGLQLGGQYMADISIRGITTGGATGATVAIMIDDVPFGAMNNSSQPPIPDFDPGSLQSVEVLKGPQGTLYGASSLGGLIKYVTKAPDTQKWSGYVEAGTKVVTGGALGDSFRGSINAPVIKDKVALDVSGFFRYDGGWLNNVPTASTAVDPKSTAGIAYNVNNKKTYGGRAALLITPTDTLSITASALVQKVTGNFADLSATSGGIRMVDTGTAPTNFTPYYVNNRTLSVAPATLDSVYRLYSVHADWKLGWATLTSVTGWSHFYDDQENDVTASFSFLPAIYGLGSGSSVQISNAGMNNRFTQELRLAGHSHLLDWTVGGFYLREHATLAQSLYLYDGSNAKQGTPYVGSGPDAFREIAGFADVTFHATDKLDLTLGGRLAHDEETAQTSVVVTGAATAVFGDSSVQTATSKGTPFTWVVSPTYHLTRDMMVYGRIATGYRPGGANVGALSTMPATYGADRDTDYEIGFKGNVVPHLLTVEAALFQVDWRNIQLQDTDVSNLTFTTNGGKARSRGVELNAHATPWHGMALDGAGTYTDAVLTQTLPTISTATVLLGSAGDRLPNSAKFSATLSAQQDFDLSDRLGAFAGVTYSYVGDRMSAFITQGNTRPRFALPAYATVDLRAGFTWDKVWKINAYARNIFNSRGLVSATNRNGATTTYATYILPTNYGVSVSRKF